MKPVRLDQARAGGRLTISVNGRKVAALAGETVAAALTAAGFITVQKSPGGENRGQFCGMGVCFQCLAVIDGRADQRTCQTLVREGMEVEIHVP